MYNSQDIDKIYNYIKDRKDTICSIQDCNMAGIYYINFFLTENNNISSFISEIDYFDNFNYDSILMEEFIWVRYKL